MNYIESNKMAWEEAYDNRKNGWGEDIVAQIKKDGYPFLEKVLIDELRNFDFKGKTIAQFCCNNGRELLSLFKMGAECGVGFDIAENMVSFANSAAMDLQMNCSFVATDILKIDSRYHGAFDYIFVTVGALTWFEDLNAFFSKVSTCLKDGGYLIINEIHPVTGMLAMEGEENFDASTPNKLVYSYFRQDPWIESNGMGYMSDSSKDYKRTFYSYSHTFADIMNEIIDNGMQINKLLEFESDFTGSFCSLSDKGIPLSYILISQK